MTDVPFQPTEDAVLPRFQTFALQQAQAQLRFKRSQQLTSPWSDLMARDFESQLEDDLGLGLQEDVFAEKTPCERRARVGGDGEDGFEVPFTLRPCGPIPQSELTSELTSEQTRAHLAALGVPEWLLVGCGATPALAALSPLERLEIHWATAGRTLEPLSGGLSGASLGILQVVYAVALSSGRSEFALCLWEIGSILGVSGDYVSRILRRCSGRLSKVVYRYTQWVTLGGQPLSAGMVWRVDVGRDHTRGLSGLSKLRVDSALFETAWRDLESDVFRGHTALGYAVLSAPNRRGVVRDRLKLGSPLPSGACLALLEATLERVEGRTMKAITAIKASFSVFDALEFSNRCPGDTAGERLGWVRQLAVRLSSVLGGERDLKGWYRVAWGVIEVGAVKILDEVLTEVLLRGSDARIRNRSALILWQLEQRGVIGAMRAFEAERDARRFAAQEENLSVSQAA